VTHRLALWLTLLFLRLLERQVPGDVLRREAILERTNHAKKLPLTFHVLRVSALGEEGEEESEEKEDDDLW
jgi:hypothetical protein